MIQLKLSIVFCHSCNTYGTYRSKEVGGKQATKAGDTTLYGQGLNPVDTMPCNLPLPFNMIV